MHPAIIIGTVRSLIVDVAMGQIPRSTERISSYYYYYYYYRTPFRPHISTVSSLAPFAFGCLLAPPSPVLNLVVVAVLRDRLLCNCLQGSALCLNHNKEDYYYYYIKSKALYFNNVLFARHEIPARRAD